MLARFLIPPSTNNRVNNRRNNNQEYLELNIGAPRSINRAKQRVVALIPSNDPAHSKRRHDLIFQNILPEILDIHRGTRGRMGEKGMWNRRLKLGGKERKEEGGKRSPSSPLSISLVSRGHPVRIRGIAASRGGHGNWEGGHTREKYEI